MIGSVTVMSGWNRKRGNGFIDMMADVKGRKIAAQEEYSPDVVRNATPEFWLREQKRLLAKLEEMALALR